MKREQWPNGRGFDYLDSKGKTRVSVNVSFPEGIQVQLVEQPDHRAETTTHSSVRMRTVAGGATLGQDDAAAQ